MPSAKPQPAPKVMSLPRAPRAPRLLRETSAPAPSNHSAGDALLRAAVEACRQHERVARLQDKGCAEDEFRDAATICELTDRHLAARTKGYEAVATNGKGRSLDDFWRAANTLWHSAHEYARRHRSCDALGLTLGKHSSGKLGELTLDYELEASALLALRQAIAGYRKQRPDAE